MLNLIIENGSWEKYQSSTMKSTNKANEQASRKARKRLPRTANSLKKAIQDLHRNPPPPPESVPKTQSQPPPEQVSKTQPQLPAKPTQNKPPSKKKDKTEPSNQIFFDLGLK